MKIPISDLIASEGTYAFAQVDAMIDELKAKGVEVIDFGVGDPTSPTPEFVRNACKEGLDKHKSSGYPSYAGSKDYRVACKNYMKKRFGVDLDPDTEIISNIGSKEAIFNFPIGFVNPGDLIIIPTPGYPPMSSGTKFAHAKAYFVGLFEENDFLIDYESIPEDIAQKAVIMWLNYPNSPTGKIADLEYYKGLIAWAKKHNIILAADEGCYIDIFFNDQKPHSILEIQKEGIIAFYSMSKRNNMTGYRIGFICGDPEILKVFSKIKPNIDSGSPDFIQEAAIVALNDDEHVEQMRQEYIEKQTLIIDTFKSMGFETNAPDATFYIWQKAPNGMSGLDFAKKFLDDKIGIVVTPGVLLSQVDSIKGINPGENFVRFALIPSLEEIKEACDRIKKYY